MSPQSKIAIRGHLPVWKKLAYAGAAVFLFVALFTLVILLEVLFRAVFVETPPQVSPPLDENGCPSPDPFQYFAISDQHLGFRNRPNGSYRTWYVRENPLCTTDEYGYRNGLGWPGGDTQPIVLFVGDSFTFCSEVDDASTGPSEVARILRREFDVRVLNAGVRAYSQLQAKRMMQECFDRFPDIRAVVYSYCDNDVAENLVPGLRYPLRVPYLVRDASDGRFEEVDPSDPIIPWGSPLGDWTPPPSGATSLEKTVDWLDDRSTLFHRGLSGWRNLTFGWGDDFAFPDKPLRDPGADMYRWHCWALSESGGRDAVMQLLLEMDALCQEHGADFVTTAAFDVGSDGYNRCKSICDEAGIRYVAPEDTFTRTPSDYTTTRIDSVYDNHYGPLGTKTFAKSLAPILAEILRARGCPPAVQGESAEHPSSPDDVTLD